MTAGLETADDRSTSPGRAPARPAAAGAYRLVLWVIVAGQAAWLAALMARGWYYQDDVAFLAQATGRTLGSGYLTEPVNDHLTPGLRLVFWLLHPLGLTSYWVTIVARVVLQAAATLLLYRLLLRLVDSARLALVVVAGYAFSPLLIGMAWLSCAANVLPAQVLLLAGYLGQLRYLRTGALRWAAAAGLAFGAAASFLELSAIDAVLLVPVVLGFVYRGGVLDRLRAFARDGTGWLLAAAPLAAFALWYAVGGYGGSARSISGSTLARFAWQQWWRTVSPMALGGPWRWASAHGVYFSATDPPAWASWATQAALALVVVAGVVVTGRRALLAWTLPLGFVALCSTALVVGRFQQFGYLSAREITYAFGAALPCALAVALAFSGRGRAGRARPTPRRWPRALLGLAAVAVVLGTALSAQRFSDRWAANPTRAYVATLRADLAARPGVHLFDTPLPLHVLPYIEPSRYLSDVLPLLHRSASFDPGARPRIVDQRGHVVPAVFFVAAQVDPGPAGAFCPHLVTGRVDELLPLLTTPQENEWFLRLDYFQQHASVVHVSLVDARGRETAPVAGGRVLLDSTLASAYLRFPSARPVAVHLRTESAATNLCLTAVQVGYPFAVQGRR